MPPFVTLPQLYWGATLEKRLDCGYPLEAPVTYPVPREGSAVAQAADGSAEDGWYLGTDYALEADIRYVPAGASAAPLAAGAAPPNGLDALLTWARQRGKVRLVPDRTTPGNYLDGYLVEPWAGAPALEGLDGSQRYHLKLRSPERSYAEALRGLLYEYVPGFALTSPRLYTATRAQAGYYIASDGTLKQAAANVLRDAHYPLGLGSTLRTTLLEPASVNSCLQSQALATTPWAPTTLVATNNVSAAPDGTVTATGLVPDATNTGTHEDQSGSITITANENLAGSLYLKANGYTGVQVIVRNGVNYMMAILDLAAGTVASTQASTGVTLTGTLIIPLASGWFWAGLWGSIGNGQTAANVTVRVFDTGAHAVGTNAFVGDTVKGVYAWGVQLERWGNLPSPPTSYMPTTTTTASRATDKATTPCTFPTQPLWGYAKLLDLGWASQANFNRLVTLSTVADGNPKLSVFTGSSAGGSNPGQYRANYNTDFNTQAAAILGSAVRGYGTPIELFWRWYADGLLELNLSINGGAVTTITAGGGNSPPALDWLAPTLVILGASGDGAALVGLQHLKLGAGTATVTTLAAAAAA